MNEPIDIIAKYLIRNWGPISRNHSNTTIILNTSRTNDLSIWFCLDFHITTVIVYLIHYYFRLDLPEDLRSTTVLNLAHPDFFDQLDTAMLKFELTLDRTKLRSSYSRPWYFK